MLLIPEQGTLWSEGFSPKYKCGRDRVGAKEKTICRGKPSREFATIPRQLGNLRNNTNGIQKTKFSVWLLKLTLNTQMGQTWSNINQACPTQLPQPWHPAPDSLRSRENDPLLLTVTGTSRGSLDGGIHVYVQEQWPSLFARIIWLINSVIWRLNITKGD